VDIPETRYARSGDVSIAYQVFGDDPVDLVLVPGVVSNVEYMWGTPWSDLFLGLASFSRLVSSTVKDLVAGSGIQFRERGLAELKGVPGEWRLFAVESADST